MCYGRRHMLILRLRSAYFLVTPFRAWYVVLGLNKYLDHIEFGLMLLTK